MEEQAWLSRRFEENRPRLRGGIVAPRMADPELSEITPLTEASWLWPYMIIEPRSNRESEIKKRDNLSHIAMYYIADRISSVAVTPLFSF